MQKIAFILLSCVLGVNVSYAAVNLGAGMSGSWFNPATNGQGVFMDVIPSRNQIFMAWFTFDPNDTSNDPASAEWFTASGEYNQGFASLDVMKTSGGRFDETTDVTHELVGYATLQFESCSQGNMTYQLFEPKIQGEFPLVRLSPDVYCESEQDGDPSTKNYNLPPEVKALTVSHSNQQIEIRFDLSDQERDWLDVTVVAVSETGQRYQIPSSHLIGHFGYPVLPVDDQWIRWNYQGDQAFMDLAWQKFKIELTADDRLVNGLGDIIEMVSEQRLIDDVAQLQGVRHRNQPAGLIAARNYIKSVMAEYPVRLTEEPFTRNGISGINLIAASFLPSQSSKYYIIDGHYDTVATTPGADDNATGTAGMLEAMRVLSQFKGKEGVQFIAFDQEELGLVGSKYHASQIADPTEIAGLINFEMIGYTCRGEPECASFPNADDSIYNIRSSFADTLSHAFMAIGETYVPGLEIDAVLDDGDPNFRRSDHAPFWDLGVDALFIADGANFRTPHYHQPSDVLQTLDTRFMYQVVKTAVGTIAQEAGLYHSDTVVSSLIDLTVP